MQCLQGALLCAREAGADQTGHEIRRSKNDAVSSRGGSPSFDGNHFTKEKAEERGKGVKMELPITTERKAGKKYVS